MRQSGFTEHLFATITVLVLASACPAHGQRTCSSAAIPTAAASKATAAKAPPVNAGLCAPQAPLAAVVVNRDGCAHGEAD